MPLWAFLEDKPLKESEINKLIKPYYYKHENRLGIWLLPTDEELLARGRNPNVLGKFNTNVLMQRGDIYGFMAIAAVVREREATGKGIDHCFATMDFFRALPAILKLPWFKDNEDMLITCVENVRRRVFGSALAYDVDWSVINRQIEDPSFETLRERRPRTPKDRRYIDLEDPIKLNC